ncbi:MAG: exopolysaccharide biosynthesis protein [Maricaulis sp.]|nr:exopolysaccharide biosynthesis protein [Maricaulis sp.]
MRSTHRLDAASVSPDLEDGRLTETSEKLGLISALEDIATAAPDKGMTLGDFFDALGERAFGVILFAMALPISIPFLYGVPQVMALPMMALSAQMALGREEPWLPSKFKTRRLDKAGLERMAQGGRKWFGWLEALARPRLTWLSGPTAERLVGVVFILFCASILVPLPATNTTPGIALAIAALGLLTRDGLLVLGGLLLGLAWIALLMTLFLFFGDAAIDVLKDFIRGLLGRAEA